MYVILAQITTIIGWLLLVYSYYKEDIEKLLFVQIISSVFYCLSYFFLGAYSGLIICFFELVKALAYYKTDKQDYIFYITLPIYFFIAYFSYDGIYSLLPVIASIIDGWVLTRNKDTAVVGGVISNFLWIIYDVIIIAYAAALTDGILVLSNLSILVLGYSRILKTDKFRVLKCRYLSRNICNCIYELDKEVYGKNYLWDRNYQKLIYSKNRDSLLLIQYQDEIVGYINYLVISENQYNKILNARKMIKEYDDEEILEFKKNKPNYLVIESINVNKKYQNYKVIKLIKNTIKRMLLKKHRDGYRIKGVLSVSVNSFEEETLLSCEFLKIKDYKENEQLYQLDFKQLAKFYITREYRRQEERNKYKLYANEHITDEMLQNICDLDKEFYKPKYLWEYDYQKEIFNKNKNSMIAVTYENELIGYLNYLAISKEKYDSIKDSDITIDDYELDDIKKFVKSKKNYITINSIVISSKYQNGQTVIMLTNRLKRELKKLNYSGYKIDGISATAVSKDGRKLLEQLGFVKYKKLSDNNYLYLLENIDLQKYLH